jgi:hypothetical protein
LVFAQLPWEVGGFTPMVVCSMGVKPVGGDVFTFYAGGGDRGVEAFQIKVNVSLQFVTPSHTEQGTGQ